MDLTFTDEQRLLADSARRYVADAHGKHRSGDPSPATGKAAAAWRDFAELGWLSLAVPEDAGGLGAGPLEGALVCTALGRGLVAAPYIASAVTAVGLLRRVQPGPMRANLLLKLAEGDIVAVVAHNEDDAETAISGIRSVARRHGDGWSLSGRKTLVRAAPQADVLFVSAHEDGAVGNAGCRLFVVPNDHRVRLTPIETLDGRDAAHVAMSDVALGPDALLASGSDAVAALEGAVEDALVASCADAVGCMEVLLDTTTDYVRTRTQFGRPLSANQVIRHRLADMACHLEEARAIALGAALCPPDDSRRALVVSSAKVKVGAAARFVAEQSVQLHGGMGVTEELNVGAFFKRLLAFEMSLGTERHHLRRAAQLRRKAQGVLQ